MGDFDYNDINQNKGKSVFCYLTLILWLVPFLAWRKSEFVRFHLNQGLNIILCGVILGAFDRLIITFLHPGLITGIWGFVYSIAWVILLAFRILGIVNAVNGQAKEIPLIGKISLFRI